MKAISKSCTRCWHQQWGKYFSPKLAVFPGTERTGRRYLILKIVLLFPQTKKKQKQTLSSAIINLAQSPNWQSKTCYFVKIWSINSENTEECRNKGC